MSYVATGFWLGITLGRFLLSVPATLYGEKPALLVYAIATLGIQFVQWFVPSITVSAVAVAFIGFFIGPMFPCAVALATKVLPRRVHLTVIGFLAAFGRP